MQDPVLREAVRAAVGGGIITEENAREVTVLRLDKLPGGWEELSLLPALEKIELSQSAALEGTLPDGDYTLVLRGG